MDDSSWSGCLTRSLLRPTCSLTQFLTIEASADVYDVTFVDTVPVSVSICVSAPTAAAPDSDVESPSLPPYGTYLSSRFRQQLTGICALICASLSLGTTPITSQSLGCDHLATMLLLNDNIRDLLFNHGDIYCCLFCVIY